MTLRSTFEPTAWTFRVPWNDDGRAMSPSPPVRIVPVAGAPVLVRTKWTVFVASRVFFALASSSVAESPDPPPVQPARTGSASSTAISANAARRSSTTDLPDGRAGPEPLPADSSALFRSAAGTDPRGDAGPLRDLGRQSGLVLDREVPQGRLELRQAGLLGRAHPEGLPDGDAVVGADHDVDGVARSEVPGLEHAEVDPGRPTGGEPLDQPRHAPEALEVGARDPEGGDLEARRPHPPLLAEQRTGQVEPAGAQVLAEPAGQQVAVELGGPPVGVLLGVGVDRLALAAVVLPVDLDVALEAQRVDGDTSLAGALVDAAAVGPAVGQRQQVGAGDADRLYPAGHFFPAGSDELDSAATKASWGTSTRPTIFIRFLPSFCFSSNLRLRVMSPP